MPHTILKVSDSHAATQLDEDSPAIRLIIDKLALVIELIIENNPRCECSPPFVVKVVEWRFEKLYLTVVLQSCAEGG